MKNSRFERSRTRGFTLIEVLMALVIFSAATVGINTLVDRFSEDTKVSLTAQHVRTFGDATKAYIKDNYAAVQTAATTTTPALIDASTLIATGYLPTGFVATNGYGQILCALVLEPTANRLQALVVSEGGQAIDDLSLGVLAATVGGSGGSVYASSPTEISGAVGGWTIATASFDGLVNDAGRRCDGTAGAVAVSAGHPLMALWFENGDTSSAFLARDAVPGRPELNEMNTPIVMNSVQVLNAVCTRLGAIARSSTGAVMSCQSGLWKTQGSSFWEDPVASFAALPTCNAAVTWRTRIVQTPTVGTGPRPYTCNGSVWVALAVNDQGNLTVPKKITGGGADAAYGAITILGQQNGWSGANFKMADGTDAGTLMMHPSYSGFYNAAQNNWRSYVDEAGNTWQNGSANLVDVYSRLTGHYFSSVSSCPSGWVWSGGSCQAIAWYAAAGVPSGTGVLTFGGCPSGYYVSGLVFEYWNGVINLCTKY